MSSDGLVGKVKSGPIGAVATNRGELLASMNEKGNKIRSLVAVLKQWLGHFWRAWSHPGEKDAVSSMPKEVPRQPVAQIFARDGHHEIAVVDLGGDISDALRASWDDARPFESGGVIDSVWLQPLFAAGSTAASSLAAGNVFLATANPETLMVIRDGLSSAIIGEGGRIIGHAPFVAASSAILPVVAPLMLFTAVSSLVTGARLDRMQRTLGTLSEVLARIRYLKETEAYAKYQSATQQLDETWSQFEHSQRFTDAMKAELVSARRDLSLLHHQFRHLTNREIRSENDIRTAMADINLFFLSSLMDIRADLLRLYLTLQDDPGYAGRRQAALGRKVAQRIGIFKALLDDDPIEGFFDEQGLKPPKGAFFDPRTWFATRRHGKTPDFEAIRETYEPIRQRMERWTSAFDSVTDSASQPSIVVYRDLDGERTLHAQHTRDVSLRPVGA